MLPLYVLISTIDAGIVQTMSALPQPAAGVCYVVSWQQTYPQPALVCDRTDVLITTLQGRGLSRNRNHALEAAAGSMTDSLQDAVFIIADDDCSYTHAAFEQVREFYAAHPRVDIALMRARAADGSYLKPYPKKAVSYRKRPRSYYVTSMEMTFRPRVWHAGLRFDERFGLGAELLCACEEEVFLTDAMRKGLTVVAVPIDLCTTNAQTTGKQLLEPHLLMSKGALYRYRSNTLRAFCRCLAESLSLSVHLHVNPLTPLRLLICGVRYISQ